MPLVPQKWYAVRCYLPTNNYGTRIFHYYGCKFGLNRLRIDGRHSTETAIMDKLVIAMYRLRRYNKCPRYNPPQVSVTCNTTLPRHRHSGCRYITFISHIIADNENTVYLIGTPFSGPPFPAVFVTFCCVCTETAICDFLLKFSDPEFIFQLDDAPSRMAHCVFDTNVALKT